MRIITGTARGKKLKEPKGEEVRPTTDRVKESLFNIIQFEIPGRDVLDLFAGTGQLGLECLSRGAASVTLVDEKKSSLALIRENVEISGLPAQVVAQEALAFLGNTKALSFDVVLLDPPYESNLLEKSLFALQRFDIVKNHGIIVCESPLDWQAPTLEPSLVFTKEYRYGKIKLSTFVKKPL